MKIISKTFYVYIYLDPRKPGVYKYGEYEFKYEPFYVGVGQGWRFKGHLKQSERKMGGKNTYCNEHKVRIINKIFKQDKVPIIIKILEHLTKEKALRKEIEIIKIVGRHDIKTGPLTNKTAGGDGCRCQSKESRKKYGEKMKKKYKTGELTAWNKGQKNVYTEEVRESISESLKEFYKTHKTWNKGITGEQKAWNKDLDITDPRVKKYSESRKRNQEYKEYKFVKDNKIVLVKNLIQYCKDNSLNNRDMSIIHRDGYRVVKWKNKKGVIIEYKYDNHRGYKKFFEEELVYE